MKKVAPDGKASVSHELPISRHSSYGQAVLNGRLSLSNRCTFYEGADNSSFCSRSVKEKKKKTGAKKKSWLLDLSYIFVETSPDEDSNIIVIS